MSVQIFVELSDDVQGFSCCVLYLLENDLALDKKLGTLKKSKRLL